MENIFCSNPGDAQLGSLSELTNALAARSIAVEFLCVLAGMVDQT